MALSYSHTNPPANLYIPQFFEFRTKRTKWSTNDDYWHWESSAIWLINVIKILSLANCFPYKGCNDTISTTSVCTFPV